ncbi:hypothetical protein CEXT_518421 [Caerostris extrusa]|uniref:Secreted protein n=1 Tax=Caerostris extrusa TaxID=172846 RepID=A0AAV4MGY6_CAEEX|nr:hypothetical protein CEXT_518421 [Caerostris extrusa]
MVLKNFVELLLQFFPVSVSVINRKRTQSPWGRKGGIESKTFFCGLKVHPQLIVTQPSPVSHGNGSRQFVRDEWGSFPVPRDDKFSAIPVP